MDDPIIKIHYEDKFHLPKKQQSKIKTGIIVVEILIICLLLASPRSPFKSTTKSSEFIAENRTPLPNISPVVSPTQDHPKIYFASLEYDPNSNQTTLIKSGVTNGELPSLSISQPKPNSNNFIYKVEVKSNQNQVYQSGWESLPIKTIETPDHKYRFQLYTDFKADDFIYLSLPSKKIIWTGKISQ